MNNDNSTIRQTDRHGNVIDYVWPSAEAARARQREEPPKSQISRLARERSKKNMQRFGAKGGTYSSAINAGPLSDYAV